MRVVEQIIYEQEDFDKVKQEMTDERAAEVLEGLPRGWFPYNLPEWSSNVTGADLNNYEICRAIERAVDKLRGDKE